ncbi:MAG TPA: FecR family protein [Myxococcales bacterium]|nr:FecR family protein [Myxococcales bacterium]
MIALALAAVMQVTFVEGPVTANQQPLTMGTELHEGDTVATAEGGRVEIALPEGAVIRLGENSRLRLQAYQPQKAFNAKLFIGNLWTKVHKLIAGETYLVETENGVAGVRGTEFRVEVEQGKPDLLRVYEGVVQMGDVRVEAGRELRFARWGKASSATFDPASEKGHKFMDWVRSRPRADGSEPGTIHHPDRNPEREHRRRQR